MIRGILALFFAASVSASGAEATNSESREPDLRCGSYCLYVGLSALDLPVKSFEELEKKLGPPSSAGYSMGELAEAAKVYNAYTLGVETSFENVRRRPGRFACIAHLDGNHFVAFQKIDERQAWIVDPPRSYTIPLETLQTRWDGKALLISAEPLLEEENLPSVFPYWTVVIIAGVFLLTILIWKFAPRSA